MRGSGSPERMAHLYKEVIVPNRGEPVTSLFIVADDDAGVPLLHYMVNPLEGFFPKLKKVPVLNVLMSPTVETFGAIKFSEFSLDRFLRFRGRTLVYRQGPNRDAYRDLTNRTVVIELGRTLEVTPFPGMNLTSYSIGLPPQEKGLHGFRTMHPSPTS